MDPEAMRRSYPERVRKALAAWEADRAEREAAFARGLSVPHPKRSRRSQRSIRTQGAARVVSESQR